MGICSNLIERYEDLSKDYYSNPILKDMIDDEISVMQWELSQSEKGQRSGVTIINPENGKGYSKYINTSSKSTFPSYLQTLFNNHGTTKKFNNAVKRGKGKVFDRIVNVAIDRLENGYQNAHGYDNPNKEFNDIVKSMKDFDPSMVPF